MTSTLNITQFLHAVYAPQYICFVDILQITNTYALPFVPF